MSKKYVNDCVDKGWVSYIWDGLMKIKHWLIGNIHQMGGSGTQATGDDWSPGLDLIRGSLVVVRCLLNYISITWVYTI